MQQEAQQEKEEREKRKADGERSRGTTTVTEAAAATGVTGTVVSSAPSDLSGFLGDDGKTVVASESAVKQQFRVHAKRTVRQYLKPIPMANSDAVMKNAVADNSVGKMVCDGINDCFAIYYTTACAGESLTAPHVRPPPVRGKEHLHKCVSVVTQARSTDDGQLLDGDIYFFVDSGRHSEVTFVNAYGPVDTRPKLTKTPLFMTSTQNSIQKRRELSRGFGQIDQVQNILLITNNPLRIPEVDRLNVANSTNRGNLVGPYSLPDWSSDDVWKVSIAKKKLMYTDKHKVAVGGPTKGAGSDSAGTADCGPPSDVQRPRRRRRAWRRQEEGRQRAAALHVPRVAAGVCVRDHPLVQHQGRHQLHWQRRHRGKDVHRKEVADPVVLLLRGARARPAGDAGRVGLQ